MIRRLHFPTRLLGLPVYSAMLYVGLVVALVTADRLARASGLDPVRVVLAFLLTIPACLAGARALAVLEHWPHYRANPRDILRLDRGNAAMYGALPPAFLLSIPLASWIGTSLGAFWDLALVAILAGMVPTRLGCLGAGCCAGRRTVSRFGMHLANARGALARRFPSPLFEALLGASLFAGALTLGGELPFAGALACAITAAYGAGRLLLEGLREERVPGPAGLGLYQWISLGLVLLGTCGLAAGWIGSLGSGGTPELARGALSGGSAHLALSALLLLPVVRLFRFVGCSLFLQEGPSNAVTQVMQVIAVVPDVGTGPGSARLELELEPDRIPIDASPIELLPAGTEPDGKLRFEALPEIPEGAYFARCVVMRDGALTRIGTCSGELNGPDLLVTFGAQDTDPPTVLFPRLCFEPVF